MGVQGVLRSPLRTAGNRAIEPHSRGPELMPNSIVKNKEDERLWGKAEIMTRKNGARPAGGIYCILNSENGKLYVGKSLNMFGRWRSHIKGLEAGTHVNSHLQRAWIKYGSHSFSFKVLACEEDAAARGVLEARLSQGLRSSEPEFGYNLNVVTEESYVASEETRKKQSDSQRARHATSPQTRSPEQRARMSAAQMARNHKASPETRALMSLASKGKPKSLEHAARIGDSHRGWVPSEETRLRIGAAHIGSKASEETRAKMSAIRTGKRHSDETRAKMSRTRLAQLEDASFAETFKNVQLARWASKES